MPNAKAISYLAASTWRESISLDKQSLLPPTIAQGELQPNNSELRNKILSSFLLLSKDGLSLWLI